MTLHRGTHRLITWLAAVGVVLIGSRLLGLDVIGYARELLQAHPWGWAVALVIVGVLAGRTIDRELDRHIDAVTGSAQASRSAPSRPWYQPQATLRCPTGGDRSR